MRRLVEVGEKGTDVRKSADKEGPDLMTNYSLIRGNEGLNHFQASGLCNWWDHHQLRSHRKNKFREDGMLLVSKAA